jgi:hypothetical protein
MFKEWPMPWLKTSFLKCHLPCRAYLTALKEKVPCLPGDIGLQRSVSNAELRLARTYPDRYDFKAAEEKGCETRHSEYSN